MGAPYPVVIPEAFAALAGGGFINTIPKTTATPGAASYDEGFPPLTMTPEIAGGVPPFGQDFNGILFALSTHTFFQQSGALYLFNAGTATAIGGYAPQTLLASTDGSTIWYNKTANNMTDPDSGGNTGWVALYSYGFTNTVVTGGSVTLSNSDAAREILEFTGALTSNQIVILPNNVQQWVIINNTTGAHTLTIKTAAGTGVAIPQTGSAQPSGIYCDGTNIFLTSISTAGLAPLASPAFTGTPTAPTAPGGTNTTQIATTAYVFGNFALIASPTFTGTPRAPTAALNTNTTQLATMAALFAARTAVPFVGSANGCIRLPLIPGQQVLLQWGSLNIGDVIAPSGHSVTFPTGFSSVWQAFLTEADSLNAGDATYIAVLTALSNTGLTFGVREIASTIQNATVRWFAIGI